MQARQDVLDFAKEFGIEQLQTVMSSELSKRFGEKFIRILYN